MVRWHGRQLADHLDLESEMLRVRLPPVLLECDERSGKATVRGESPNKSYSLWQRRQLVDHSYSKYEMIMGSTPIVATN